MPLFNPSHNHTAGAPSLAPFARGGHDAADCQDFVCGAAGGGARATHHAYVLLAVSGWAPSLVLFWESICDEMSDSACNSCWYPLRLMRGPVV